MATEKKSAWMQGNLARWGIALAASLLLLLLETFPPTLFRHFDESLRDVFLRAVADGTPEERVLIVDIDDNSLRRLGPWPWPRSRVADLVEVLLTDYQAKAVGLDIVFPEAGDSEGDTRLAMLARYAPVTLAEVFDFTPRVPRLAQGTLARPSLPVGENPTLPAFGHIANHASLSEAARCVGNIGYVPASDGVLRHTPVFARHGSAAFPQFALALVHCAPPDAPPLPRLRVESQWRIPFRHTTDAYTVIPAAEILALNAPHALVEGRYVIVGSSSLSLGDRVSTPLDPLVSGMLVHAQSVSALLDISGGKVSFPGGRVAVLLLVYALLSMFLAVYWIRRMTAWGSVLLLLGLGALWLGLAFFGVTQQVERSLLAPLVGYLLLLLTIVPHEWRQTQRQNRHVLALLSHYVARPVLEELVRQGEAYRLVPTLREITVLVADMEGYTRMTSALELEDAAQVTKDFLDCLTRPVLAHDGTLDKYSGDGLVAFWGAPLVCADQADKAVEAALEIQHEVELFNVQQKAAGFPAVRVRIGIESGPALVGDLGTPFRSTYTAVGDCINFAARLESVARDFPTQLLIGPCAQAQVRRHATRSLGEVMLRGVGTRIAVYTIVVPEHHKQKPL
ncbi:MAG: adenylate/guanylate cyclase domain-containing protein [Zoogloeaceae bacterium]|jgi:adenylate cyclase|nr:adenylate/guanylate cyclase domain-containing protein [Zoogloeaceae bacterium]